ncbi:MAG TPA: glutamate--tRNA ligase family protein, partial [Candidatus Poseidoniales archaeon]|nr:glutamate--tRNA ligase family protein [Candidatus Poseidoniales archaeon]
YDGLGWTYPETIYWGRVKIHDLGAFSTSQMRRSVEEGEVSDWDDPRLPTLRSLKRRGYAPEAMRDFWIDLGLTRKDISVSMATLDKFNTRRIDGDSRRATLVRDPVHIELTCDEGHRTSTIELPIHPDHPERGNRVLHLNWSVKGTGIHIESQDAESLKEERRLRGWADITATANGATVLRTSREHGRSQIHWLPDGDGVTGCVLEHVDGDKIQRTSALIEGSIGSYKHGEIIQLERIGFATCEHRKEGLVLMMLHG